MLNCQALDLLVTPYIDGELADDDRRAIAEHLRACPPCHSRVAAERAVHDLIQARKPSLHAACAPERLRTACSSLAARASAPPPEALRGPDRLTHLPTTAPAGVPRATPGLAVRPLRGTGDRGGDQSWRARAVPFALAASLVVGVGGAFVYQATDQSARILAAQLTADHLKCFAANSVFGTHQAASTVESSMLSAFGWSMHLPQHGDRAGLELVGARQCLSGKGRVAHIMYRHEGRPVSLFMLPRTARTRELVDVLGHEAAIWCVGDRTFVLIAKEPRHQVEQLASFVQAELR
jgi:anti-sigma factor RsiW